MTRPHWLGSPHLAPVVERHAEDLGADWCAWEGAGRDAQGIAQVVCGMKGLLYVELRATGPAQDANTNPIVITTAMIQHHHCLPARF